MTPKALMYVIEWSQKVHWKKAMKFLRLYDNFIKGNYESGIDAVMTLKAVKLITDQL